VTSDDCVFQIFIKKVEKEDSTDYCNRNGIRHPKGDLDIWALSRMILDRIKKYSEEYLDWNFKSDHFTIRFGKTQFNSLFAKNNIISCETSYERMRE